MKHWCAIPNAGEFKAENHLQEWLYEHGWGIQSYMFETYSPTRRPGPLRVFLTICPAWAPGSVTMTVLSGVTLVYDDTEKTMGVTDKPEPQDARPAQLEDAVPGAPR